MKKLHRLILNAFLSDCKRSDRDIAKVAETSQPTVTRVRRRLVDNGIIKAFMAIPDYTKLGYKFGAVITGQFPTISDECIVASAPAIFSEGDAVLITLHKTVEDCNMFLDKLKAMKREGSKVNISFFNTHGLEIKPVQVQDSPFIVLEG